MFPPNGGCCSASASISATSSMTEPDLRRRDQCRGAARAAGRAGRHLHFSDGARGDLRQARPAVARHRREDRSRTSPARSTSTRSSRRERGRAATGWARVCGNIAGSRRRSGLSFSSPPSLASAHGASGRARRRGPSTRRSSRCFLHQHERRQEPRQSRSEPRARSVRDAVDLPDVPDGLALGPAVAGSAGHREEICARTATSLKSGDKLRVQGAAHRRRERRDRLVGQLRIRG